MAEHQSRLETLKADAIAHATDQIVRTLQSQGVSEARALQYVDQRVTFVVDQDLRVIPQTKDLDGTERPGRGWSDPYLAHFAKVAHWHNRETLGGTPVAPGLEATPEFEWKLEAEERRTQARKAASESFQRREAASRQHRAELEHDRAERALERHHESLHGKF